jgi:hypothetical protein
VTRGVATVGLCTVTGVTQREHDRLEFCIGEVFPANDELARWVMSLSIALCDLRVAAVYAVREEQPDYERGYFVRMLVSHMRELVKVLVVAVEKRDALRDFVAGLPPEVRAHYDEMQRLIERPMVLRPKTTLFDELKRIRDTTWHYPVSKAFVDQLRDAMRRAAASGDRGVYVFPKGTELGYRAEYADLVAHFLAYPLDGTDEEVRAQFRELHQRLIKLLGPIAKFLQGVEGEYLVGHVDKIEVKDRPR